MEICNGTYCVYVHTNKINGKKYVGQTIYGNNPNRRWKYGNGYKNNFHFNSAINKYGWDNFKHEIIFENLTKEEADNFEKLLIEELDTTNPEYGYNITAGGDGALQRHQTQETKDKISKAKIGKYAGENHPRAKSVAQYDLDGNLIKVWDYIKQAGDELGINKGDISRCCKGLHFSVGNYIWRYAENKNDVLLKIEINKPKNNRKPVLCIETGFVYESAAEASRQTNINKSIIANCCNGRYKTAGGFHWEWYKSNVA